VWKINRFSAPETTAKTVEVAEITRWQYLWTVYCRQCNGIHDFRSRLFKVLYIFRWKKKSGSKSKYNRQFCTSIFYSNQLKFYPIRKITLDSFSANVILFELPFSNFNQHLLKCREVLQNFQRHSMLPEAFTMKYRLQKVLSLHLNTPSRLGRNS